MRGLVLLGCLLAACDDGVVLEVYPPPNIPTESVQLFIGLDECFDCPGIQPPGAGGVLPGSVYYREDSNRNLVVRTAPVENGVARFRIEASDVGGSFDFAVAVDAAGRSAAMIQSLPLDTAGRYHVDLEPATTNGMALGPKPTTTAGNFVAIWQQPNGTLPCMGFEKWDAGELNERVFIVPADDLDCDGALTNDCAPYGYETRGVPTFEETSCTTLELLADNINACKLGGPACEGTTTCAPSEYCVPLTYCGSTLCPASPPPTGYSYERCLFETPLPATRLKCLLAFKPSSDGLHADPCTSSVGFDLQASMPVTTGVDCEPTPDDKNLLARSPDGALAFTDAVAYPTGDGNFELKIRLGYTHDACNYQLDLNGSKALDAQTVERSAFAQFWITRNGGPVRKALVPLELTLVNDCGVDSRCVLVIDPADNIGKCMIR